MCPSVPGQSQRVHLVPALLEYPGLVGELCVHHRETSKQNRAFPAGSDGPHSSHANRGWGSEGGRTNIVGGDSSAGPEGQVEVAQGEDKRLKRTEKSNPQGATGPSSPCVLPEKWTEPYPTFF